MRPTFLQFKSPRERTPDPALPMTTCDGRSLSKTPPRSRPTLPQSKRFPQYEEDAKKTGFSVGPGRYNKDQTDLGKHASPGAPVYREFHANKDVGCNGFYYAGNHLVYEPSLVAKRTPKKECPGMPVLASHILNERGPSRSTTAKPRRRKQEEVKAVPWFLRISTTDNLKQKERLPTPKKDQRSSRKALLSPYLAKVVASPIS